MVAGQIGDDDGKTTRRGAIGAHHRERETVDHLFGDAAADDGAALAAHDHGVCQERASKLGGVQATR